MSSFGARSTSHAPPLVPAEMSVDLIESSILRLRLSGYIDGPLVVRATARMREVMASRTARLFLADTLSITGVDATMRSPGLEMLGLMKVYGITNGFISVASPMVRLLASTLGMASGFRLELVPSTDVALRKAQAALRGEKE